MYLFTPVCPLYLYSCLSSTEDLYHLPCSLSFRTPFLYLSVKQHPRLGSSLLASRAPCNYKATTASITAAIRYLDGETELLNKYWFTMTGKAINSLQIISTQRIQMDSTFAAGNVPTDEQAIYQLTKYQRRTASQTPGFKDPTRNPL